METMLITCFYSTCLSPELHPIVSNLIRSSPCSSVNFHLVGIFTKDIEKFIFSPSERLALKKSWWHFVIAQQYAATKPDSFSNIQIRKICFQKYNMLSQYCLIKFHKVLRLFYDFRAFHFHVTRLLILAVIFVKLDWRICTRRTSTLATCKWTL